MYYGYGLGSMIVLIVLILLLTGRIGSALAARPAFPSAL